MDYGSLPATGGALAMTGVGLGWVGAAIDQLWILGIAAAILLGGVVAIRIWFRRGKTPEEI